MEGKFRRGHDFPGLWIVLEGPDGAGKSRHQRNLHDYLTQQGYNPLSLREPGSTVWGEHLRGALLDPAVGHLSPKTEAVAFVGAGIEMFEGVIKPALQHHRVVLQDRWRQSTKAYQGYGGGVDLKMIDLLTEWSTDGARPDLTLMIDIPPHFSQKNIGARDKDRMERNGGGYSERVRQGYLEMARQDPVGTKLVPYLDGQFETMQAEIRKIFHECVTALDIDRLIKNKPISS